MAKESILWEQRVDLAALAVNAHSRPCSQGQVREGFPALLPCILLELACPTSADLRKAEELLKVPAFQLHPVASRARTFASHRD